MRFASFALITALAACGSKGKPVQLAPLPDDPKPAAEAKPAATPAPAVEPGDPPVPAGPVEVKIPAPDTTVKLVGKGKGKLAPLRYTSKPGAKQAVELALDFASTETLGAATNQTVMPTIVLTGEAETKAIDKDGRAEYAVTIRATDAREVQGSKINTAELKTVVASLAGLVIGGTVGANGTAGEVTMRVDKPDHLSEGALEMIRLTLPGFPVLPAEAVGVGAKWQTTTITKLAEKIVVKQVTDYELVEAKGAAWTIKGKTVVSGSDQQLNGSTISKIGGSGTSELTLAAGALYPTYKTSLETQFTASEKDASMVLALRTGGTVTAK